MKRIAWLFALPLLFSLVGLVPAQEKPPAKPKAGEHGKGYVPISEAKLRAMKAAAKVRHGAVIATLLKTVTPPPAFNCADLGIMPPQDDQGSCGSCYLVSSGYVATSAFIKGGWGKNDGSFWISSQYGLDCKSFGGCGGGDEAEVFAEMKDNGFPAEKYMDLATGTAMSDYGQYTAREGRCQLKSGAKMWKLKDFGFVAEDGGRGPATLDQYKVAMMTYGCLSIALDAGFMNDYQSGVATRLGDGIDHAIKAYAWDDNKDCGDGTKGAMLFKNNWGKSWGMNGDCWVAYHELKHVVEPIWALAPTVTPPGPGPGPTPPPVPPGPTPPPAPGAVTIPLNAEQVASVNAQSGAVVISGGMTLQQIADLINAKSGYYDKNMTIEQLLEAVQKSKSGAAGPPTKTDCGDAQKLAERLKELESSNAEVRKALIAVQKALLKKE